MTVHNEFYIEFMADPPLTMEEVAARFRVDPKTVARWCARGKVNSDKVFRTPGGHRRIRTSGLDQLLDVRNRDTGEHPRPAVPQQRTKSGAGKRV